MLLSFSCAVNRQPHASSVDIIEFDTSRLATFYYTEALKKTIIYDSLDAALLLLDKAIEQDSTHAPSYYEAANIMISKEDIPAAVRYSSRAYALDSLNTWYKNQRGRLYIQSGQYYPALKIYRDLVHEDPYNPETYRLLAALYLEEKMPLAAISLLDSAEYKIGKIEELSEMKRGLLAQTGQIEKAIAETEEYLANFPYDENSYLVLADMYGFSKKDSLQLATLKKLLAENPNSVNGLLSMSEYYQRKGDITSFIQTLGRLFESDRFPVEDKIELFTQLTGDINFYRDFFPQMNSLVNTLISRYSENYKVIDIYAKHQISIGEIEHALLIYKAQIEKPDAPIEIFNSIFDIETYLQRPDSVEKYTGLALERFGDRNDISSGILLRRGSAQQYMQQNSQALATFKRGLKNAPSDSLKSVFAGTIGDLYHLQNNPRKAFSYYDKALRYNQSNDVVLNNYAYYLSEQGVQLERALEMSRQSNTLSKSNPTYLDTQAWVLYKLGRPAEAKPLMQQALSLDRSASPVLLVHYGDILYALGDKFMASIYWKRAREAGYDAEEIDKRISENK